MAGQQLTMEVYCAIVVEESERFDFKLLKRSRRIEAVFHRCISRTSIKNTEVS